LFLANFTEVETVNEPEQKQRESSVPAIPKNQENELFKQTQNTFSELSTMLMDDIKKVREKPEYVSQAKQVCNSVNAMVNMTKLQMQILKNR
jgi:tRNA A37 threonylcarbamoyltransferase TsaD